MALNGARASDTVTPVDFRAWYYARALYNNDDATLDDLRKAVTTLGDLALTVRRVFGGSNPLTTEIDDDLREVRAALRARETSPGRK